jgi:hypothetical protein
MLHCVLDMCSSIGQMAQKAILGYTKCVRERIDCVSRGSVVPGSEPRRLFTCSFLHQLSDAPLLATLFSQALT